MRTLNMWANELRPQYWKLDVPARPPNTEPCPCCEIELPQTRVHLNAVDDYGNFCTLGFPREAYETFKQKVKFELMLDNQRIKARNFRLNKMRVRT